jgi:hypothetical protein
MNITKEHIDYKRQIGTLDNRPVIELATTGGLHLVVVAKGDGVETLGAGPHRAVARHIAKKLRPDLKITALEKSDDLPLSSFAHMVPLWEQFTNRNR